MKSFRLLLAFSILLVSGCSGRIETFFSDNQKEVSLDSPAVESISWKAVGNLPAPDGFSRSIGISAAYTGFLGDYLIVAGGANFPNGHPVFDQAHKKYYSDIFVIDISDNHFEVVGRGQLPVEIGYGATVVVDNSLYLVGGKSNEQAFSSIIKLTLDNVDPKAEVIGNLPFTWTSGGAAWENNALYLFAGEQDGQVSNQVCKYSFELESCIDRQWVPAIPGVSRVHFPSINHSGNFYIFGGIDDQGGKDMYVLTDVYAFEFNREKWISLPPISIDEQLFSVSGGGVVAISKTQLLLLGGVNREIFNNALLQLHQLKEEALSTFKQSYFSLPPEEYKLSRRQLVFNVEDNSWGTLNEDVPFLGGAGPLPLAQNKDKIYWISGEIKPVVRTPVIYQGALNVKSK